MPRRARLLIANQPLHIIQRGNNRSACFYCDDDCDYYLETLDTLRRAHHVDVHAYVLMTNHVHLLVTPAIATGPSQLMKHLGQRYVQYINRTYRRTGSLWEGRFRSSIVDSESYLLACQRYIELNPVRAGMIDHPGDYPWSSFQANAHGHPNPLLCPHDVYLRLGTEPPERQAAYRELFGTELPAELIDTIRTTTNGGFVLGNDRFKEQIAAALQRRVAPGTGGRPRKTPASESQTGLDFN